MKHLISREDYIKEYLRINRSVENIIDKEIENNNELYEGLLSTVFGGLKMLFKKDWANVKSKNPTVLEHLKDMDKRLAGYTMIKMQYSSECQNIRQNIADYFNDILEYKLLQIEKEENADKFIEKENKEKEENTEENGVAKILNLKDKTLLESLKKYKDNIATQCKASPKLREYADQLLNSVTVFVNDIILAELEKKGVDKAKLEEEKKKLEEEKKKLEEEAKKKDEEAKKANEESLKKLKEERDKSLQELGIKPIGDIGGGDKAIDEIISQYKKVLEGFSNAKVNESALPGNYSELLNGDTYIGIQKSLEEINWAWSDKEDEDKLYDRTFIRIILSKINNAFDVITNSKSDYKKVFKEIPPVSVQAMMVSIANAIIYGYVGKDFKLENNNARLSLMTKCAIDSDPTIGFNLPLLDDTKPDNGNYFVGIMNQFKSGDVNSDEVKDVVSKMTDEEIKKLKEVWEGKNKNKDNKESDSAKKSNKDSEKTDDSKVKEDVANKVVELFGDDIMKQFQTNMKTLFDLIVKKADEIKKSVEKEREQEAAKAQSESDKVEKTK